MCSSRCTLARTFFAIILAISPYMSFPTTFALAEAQQGFRYSAYLYTPGMDSSRDKIPSFSCDDEIHLKIRWEGMSSGSHEFEILWIDENEKVWEGNREKIFLKTPMESFTSDHWFAFKRSMFERFIGYELGKSKKAGKWHVKVRLNGDLVLTKKYDVEC
jgi:hypothetical protein